MGMIKFNGASSKDFGVEVETFPNYVAPQKEYEAIHIPGRNGDLLIDSGTYSNVEKRYKVNMVKEPPATEVSGPIANFKSNTALPLSELKTNIDPVQDLHGYSKPWIGGAGKNKLKITESTQTINGITFTISSDGIITTSGTWSINATCAVTVSFSLKAGTYILNGCPSGGSYSKYVLRIENSQAQRLALDTGNGEQFTLAEDTLVWCRIYIYSQDGIGKTFAPMVRLVTESDASFEPYENICPISGSTGVSISRTGKNLCDPLSLENLYSNYDYAEYGYRCRKIQLAPNTTYTVSFTAPNAQSTPIIIMNNRTAVNTSGYFDLRKANDIKTYITDETGCLYIGLYPNVADDVANARLADCSIQIEIGNQATDYEPYKGSKYQTFFEGLANGPYGFYQFDGTEQWEYITSWTNPAFRLWSSYFTNKITNAKAGGMKFIIDLPYRNVGSNNASWSGIADLGDKVIGGVSSAAGLVCRDDSITSASDFKASLIGKTLIYELATPTAPTITQFEIDDLISKFDADLVTVVFGQTVYGGVADVTNGKVTVTHGGVVAGGNIAGPLHTANNGWAFTLSDYDAIFKQRGETISNINVVGNYWGISISGFCFAISSKKPLFFLADSDTGLNENSSFAEIQTAFTTFCNNNSPFAVYELDTPTEISTTPETLKTFIGDNNIFSDTGDVTIKNNELATTYSGKMELIANWLNSASGYARLEDSYDPDYYRLAYFNQALDIENVYDEAGRVELSFICKPQKFYKSGEDPVVFTSAGKIQNRTQHAALPLLKVKTDNTDGTVSIGNSSFGISAGSGTDIIIDCELQNAYYGIENKNNYIVLNDGDFPRIEPGTQVVSFTGGVQSVEVIPRWWTV